MKFFRFDPEKGAKYLVSIHRWNVSDQYYYDNYREAKAFFNKVSNEPQEEGTAISIWDMKKDIRKDFNRF